MIRIPYDGELYTNSDKQLCEIICCANYHMEPVVVYKYRNDSLKHVEKLEDFNNNFKIFR